MRRPKRKISGLAGEGPRSACGLERMCLGDEEEGEPVS